MNKMHESNHTKWNAAAPRWKARRDSKGPWHRGHLVPERVEKALEYWRANALTEQGVEHIAQHLGSLEGKKRGCLGQWGQLRRLRLGINGGNSHVSRYFRATIGNRRRKGKGPWP